MSVEINDQKLIDIVYVDDEGNKHKYSGPFINDLTITSEIQEKLDTLTKLNSDITDLKTRLDTFNSNLSSKIKYVTEIPSEPETNTCYVLPSDDAVIIQVVRATNEGGENTEQGWINFTDVMKSEKNSIIYLGLEMGNIPSAFRLKTFGSNWNSTYLPEVYYVQFGPTGVYENGVASSISAPITLVGNERSILIKALDYNENLIWRGTFKLGFKPKE